MRIRFDWRVALVMAACVTATTIGPAHAQAIQTPGSGTPMPEAVTGDNRQPRWTTRPVFAETDVYVLPKGVAAFVFSLRPTVPTSGAAATESEYRAEFGLPARFQLGLHASGRTHGETAIGNIDAQAVGVRWAFAEWGRVWGNPAIHVEWREASRGADVGSVKLLLGGGGALGWRWGTNVAWTQEASAAREIERAWTAGVSYGARRIVSVGLETRLALTDRLMADPGARTAMTRQFLAGPSLQIRPVRQMYIDVAPLFGTTTGGPRSRTTLVAGWEF